MLDPTPPALWSLFSARWFLTGLFSSSQLGSISRRYWVSCHCDGHPWNMNKPSQPVVHTFRILIQFFISDLVVPVDIADHRPFSYFLSLLSTARRAIHKESLTNAVIRPDRSFEAILLSYRLPDVASRMKAHMAVLRRAVMSLWAPLSLLIRLPR